MLIGLWRNLRLREGFPQCKGWVSKAGLTVNAIMEGRSQCISCLLIQTIPRVATGGSSACLTVPLGVRWWLESVNQLMAVHSLVGQVHVSNCSLVSCFNTGTLCLREVCTLLAAAAAFLAIFCSLRCLSSRPHLNLQLASLARQRTFQTLVSCVS